MSFGIYVAGFILMIVGLAYGAYLLHVPPRWIGTWGRGAGWIRDTQWGGEDPAARFVVLIAQKSKYHGTFTTAICWFPLTYSSALRAAARWLWRK